MPNAAPLTFFKQITRIPRDTGDEKAISDYLVEFAQSRNLDFTQDEAWNVVIRKPGSKGCEHLPGLAMQAHIDMVYIKSEDCSHDYHTPLELIEEDGLLRANGTSLGADNGIGAAYMLAVLDADNLSHPPLEMLFTSGEEGGMLGATKLTANALQARRLINLDNEEEGTFLAGCAGGQRTTLSLPVSWEMPPSGYLCFRLRLQGLLGGHSGIEINLGRGNALRLLGRFLHALHGTGILVGEVQGGSKMNAIPDRAEALLYLPESQLPELNELVKQWQAIFTAELSSTDPGITLSLDNVDNGGKALSSISQQQLTLLLICIPTGVQTMSGQLPGLVESSNNLGVLRTEGNEISLSCAIRSSVGSLKRAVSAQLEVLARSVGATVTHAGIYPEWTFRSQSALRDTAVVVYSQMYGTSPGIAAIHAGLECGYFCELFPGLDVISLGPNMKDVHTPLETLDLASTQRVWEYLQALLASLCVS